MPTSLVHAINVLSIEQMCHTYGLSQRIFIFRFGNQMNMIRHQTIALYIQPESIGLLLKKPEVHLPIVINKKHILIVVPPLGYMIRHI